MTRSLFEPELLRKLISEKKRQLREIQEDLKKLPLEDSSRPRLLERMWHLLKGIPQLEAKLAELTETQESDPAGIHSLQPKVSSRSQDETPDTVASSSSSSQRVEVPSVGLTEIQSSQSDSGFAKRKTGKKKRRSSTDQASRRRAKLVAQVLEELLVLKRESEFDLAEDFEAIRAKRKYSETYIFTAAAKFPEIVDLLLTVKGTRNQKPMGLAKEIVAKGENASLHTVISDWKKHKPRELRSR